MLNFTSQKFCDKRFITVWWKKKFAGVFPWVFALHVIGRIAYRVHSVVRLCRGGRCTGQWRVSSVRRHAGCRRTAPRSLRRRTRRGTAGRTDCPPNPRCTRTRQSARHTQRCSHTRSRTNSSHQTCPCHNLRHENVWPVDYLIINKYYSTQLSKWSKRRIKCSSVSSFKY